MEERGLSPPSCLGDPEGARRGAYNRSRSTSGINRGTCIRSEQQSSYTILLDARPQLTPVYTIRSDIVGGKKIAAARPTQYVMIPLSGSIR